MKQFLLTVTLLLFSISGFSQSACNTYNGDYNAILSAVKSRNTSEGQHKLSEGHLESIAKYWQAVCKCEEGVSTDAEAEKLANIIFENKSHYTDYFLDHGKKVNKDKTPFGDLYPTSKIYTKSSCLKVGKATTMEASMNCTPEAQSFVSKAKDSQQYGKAFFRAYCECKNGVSSKERGNQLAAEMKLNHKNYHAYRASAEPRINTQPLAASACPLVSGNGSGYYSNSNDKFSYVNDDLINADARMLIGNLAANSDNPHLKEFSQKLDGIAQVQGDVDAFRNTFNITPTQSDLQFEKVMTNTAQIIAGGQMIVKMFKQNKQQRNELTPDQKMGNSFMWDMRNKIRLVYSEARVIPAFDEYNQSTIDEIEKLERSYLAYDIATAAERCAIAKFFWTTQRYGYTEILEFYNTAQGWSKREQLEYIEKWQGYADYDHAIYLANSDESFKVNRAILLSKKARCYKNMGKDEEAEKLLAMVDLDMDATEAITLMQNAFIDSDYELASLYYPIIKNKFESEETPLAYYSFDTGEPLIIDKNNSSGIAAASFVGASNMGSTNSTNNHATKSIYLSRNDVIMLLASGSIISIYNGDITAANQELVFLSDYINNRPNESSYTDEDHTVALSILDGIKSAKLLQENKPEEALVQMEKTLALKSHTELLGTKYTLWLKQIYFDILVANKRYDQAHELYVSIKMNPLVANPEYSLFFDSNALMFKKCELLYAQGEYQRVLNGLDLLETIAPNPKYNLMRSKVYNAMGEYEKSREELNNI